MQTPYPSNKSMNKSTKPQTMELQFQQPQYHHQQQCHYQEQVIKPVKSRGRRRSKSCGSSSKFVGVRQRPSGRWVAEIKDTTQKIRMWLGTFETAEEAARAYDEAACLLRGSNTRTNFATTTHSASTDSPLASRIRSLLDHKKLNKKNKNAPQPTALTFSPPAYHHASAATSCIAPNGNASISSDSSGTSFAMISNGIDTATGSLSNQQFADEVYRPFLINGCEELDQSWAFDAGLPLAAEIAELDKMRMEKQVSAASIHGMNGIQDYFDMGHDPSDTLWDLPPICQLSCMSLMY